MSTVNLVAIGGGVTVFLGYLFLIAVPAWRSYSRLSQRFSALILTLYILFVLVLAGVGGGLAILWSWDRF